MPYIYSLAAAAHFNGEMIMRSLIAEYPDDDRVCGIEDEYLFGPFMLIAPVYVAMYYLPGSEKAGDVQKSRDVYLPKGCGWYDFHTGKYYEGGQIISSEAPIDRIPVFVREGAIIPLSDKIGFADKRDGVADRIRVYEGCDASFKIYYDEGDGYGFEKDEYGYLELKYSESSHRFLMSRTGNYPTEKDPIVERVKRSEKGADVV